MSIKNSYLNNLDFRIKKNQKLRKRVFERDQYSCKSCGTKPVNIPDNYDGKNTLTVSRLSKSGFPGYLVVEHIIPKISQGCSHNINNLQTYCDICNSAKVSRDNKKYMGCC